MADHEDGMRKLKERLSTVEDIAMQHQRALRHLLYCDLHLTMKYEDLQNRLTRNDKRIFQIPEGNEGGDTI